MLIRALSNMAGPQFTAYAGKVVDLPPERARELIDAGAALPVSVHARSAHLPILTCAQDDIAKRQAALARLAAEEAAAEANAKRFDD